MSHGHLLAFIRTYFRPLCLREKDRGIKEVIGWISTGFFLSVFNIFVPFREQKAKLRAHDWVKPKESWWLALFSTQQTSPHSKRVWGLLVILNLACVQVSRPPYYCFPAINYIRSTIPLIPFQSKFPLSGGDSRWSSQCITGQRMESGMAFPYEASVHSFSRFHSETCAIS